MSESSAAQNRQHQLKLEHVLAEYLHSVEKGQPLDRHALLAANPDLADDLQSFFRNHDSIHRLAVPLKAAVDAPTILGVSDMSPVSIGTTVRYFGDYELLDEIAHGGMGVVFKARQVNLNRVVALKMILAGQLANDSDVKRFYAEAEAAAKLDHPGIVPIFEIGQHDGQHYFSMAFIDGESLANRVANGPLPPREAAQLVKQVAEAVEYAHQKGIIHRDLKPANVLLDAVGQPKVTDFGLAKQTQGDSGLTGTGQILGTPSYMPPEQAAGKIDQVGPQSDVYSLGAILYCLVTGRPPFQAASPTETLLQVLKQEPVAPRQLNPLVPLDLETIALKCLEKEAGRRYAKAVDLAEELARFLRGEPILARPVGFIERAWRWSKRNRKEAAYLATVACLLIVGIVVATSLARVANWKSQVAEWNAQLANENGRRAGENAERANKNADAARDEALRATRLAGELEKSLAAEAVAREKADDEADRARQAAEKEAEARQATRRALYAAQMNLAWQSWEQGNLARVEEALEAHKSPGKDEDLRGFEWYHLWWLTHRYQSSIAGAFLGDPSMWLDLNARRILLRSVANDFMLWNLDSRKVEARIQVPLVAYTANQTLRMRPAVSADMTTVAMPGKGKILQLRNLATGKVERELEHDEPVLAIAYAPDGKTLAAGGEAGTLIAWDTDTGRRFWQTAIVKPANVAPATQPGVAQVSFSPDGTRIATKGFDSAQLWNAKTGESLGTLTRTLPYAGMVGSPLQFSADGQFVIISDAAPYVVIWNVESLEEAVIDKTAEESFGAIAISRDGAMLATGAAMIRLRDLGTGQVRGSLPGTTDPITAMAFSPDNRRLAAATSRGTILLHDTDSGKVRRTLHGHKGRVLQLAITNDGGTLVSRSMDGTVKIWDLNDNSRPALLRGHSAPIRSLAMSPAGELLSLDAAGMLKRWDVQSGNELASQEFSIDQSPPNLWMHAELSGDGQSVAICTRALVGHVLDCTTGKERFRFSAPLGFSKHRDFSHDGKLFAAQEGNRVRVWETVSGQEHTDIPAPAGGFLCLALLANGKQLATTDMQRECIWNIADGKPAQSIWNKIGAGVPFIPSVLSCSPDGRILAAGARYIPGGLHGSSVQLWDLARGKEIDALRGEQTGVANLVFSPDSKSLVLSVNESPARLKLWNVAVREEVATLRNAPSISQPSGSIDATPIAFSQNGQLLARGNSDGTIDLFWGESNE